MASKQLVSTGNLPSRKTHIQKLQNQQNPSLKSIESHKGNYEENKRRNLEFEMRGMRFNEEAEA